MEGVGVTIKKTEPVLVQAADHAHGLQPVLDEIVKVGLDDQLQTLPLEDRQQVVHRLQEVSLRGLWRLWPAAELRVDHIHPKIDGDLDNPLPGAYGCLSLVLIRP